jgi:hypothetical protein
MLSISQQRPLMIDSYRHYLAYFLVHVVFTIHLVYSECPLGLLIAFGGVVLSSKEITSFFLQASAGGLHELCDK